MKAQTRLRQTLAFLIAIITAFTLIIPIQARAVTVYSYQDMLTDLRTLENYAEEYCGMTDTIETPQYYVLIYVRSGTYASTYWNVLADEPDAEFEAYVTKQDVKNKTTASALKHLSEITLPDGDVSDMVHMFATMNMLYTGFGDLGGWAGDLCQIATDAKSCTTQTDIDAYLLTHFDAASNSRFGHSDLIADMDALNIFTLLEQTAMNRYSDAIDAYYSTLQDNNDRISRFIQNRFAGLITNETTLSDFEDLVFNEYRDTSLIGLLELKYGIADGSAYLQEKTSCKIFADYLNQVLNLPLQPVNPYTDVDQSMWYYDSILQARRLKLMNGYGNDCFGPEDSVTRAQMAQILYNYYNGDASDSCGFIDVNPDDWYFDAVAYAQSKNIMNGYENGCFGPNDTLTLEQAAQILYNIAGNPDVNVKTQDGKQYPASDWAVPAMTWATKNQLISDYLIKDTAYEPITRGEIADMFVRYIASLN